MRANVDIHKMMKMLTMAEREAGMVFSLNGAGRQQYMWERELNSCQRQNLRIALELNKTKNKNP